MNYDFVLRCIFSVDIRSIECKQKFNVKTKCVALANDKAFMPRFMPVTLQMSSNKYQLYHVSERVLILGSEMFFPFEHCLFQKTLWARIDARFPSFLRNRPETTNIFGAYLRSLALECFRACGFPRKSRENSINIYAHTTQNF